jgi:hypothetical protein
MIKVEPDQVLYSIESALDKLTDLLTSIRRTGQKPAVYRQILKRRIHLNSISKQMRGEKSINIRNN